MKFYPEQFAKRRKAARSERLRGVLIVVRQGFREAIHISTEKPAPYRVLIKTIGYIQADAGNALRIMVFGVSVIPITRKCETDYT